MKFKYRNDKNWINNFRNLKLLPAERQPYPMRACFDGPLQQGKRYMMFHLGWKTKKNEESEEKNIQQNKIKS